MTNVPGPRYRDAAGNAYAEKPEHMTQLRGSRIALRGKLDSLLAKGMEVQAALADEGLEQAAEDLDSFMKLISAVLMGEVADMPLDDISPLGLDSAALREHSHNPKKFYGVDHMLPSYRMGKGFTAVNAFRAATREVELAAVAAFTNEEGGVSRPDLVEAMNHLSSAAYIVMCRLLGGYYRKD